MMIAVGLGCPARDRQRLKRNRLDLHSAHQSKRRRCDSDHDARSGFAQANDRPEEQPWLRRLGKAEEQEQCRKHGGRDRSMASAEEPTQLISSRASCGAVILGELFLLN
jgi:hypothetical protein